MKIIIIQKIVFADYSQNCVFDITVYRFDTVANSCALGINKVIVFSFSYYPYVRLIPVCFLWFFY